MVSAFTHALVRLTSGGRTRAAFAGAISIALFLGVVPVVAFADDVVAATVSTDKDDYEPGETVVITGAGFEAGEEVTLTLTEDPAVGLDPAPWVVVADENGGFEDRTFTPNERHLGVTFTLVATGATSGRTAQTTFTDARTFFATFNPTSMPTGSTRTINVTVTNRSALTPLGLFRINKPAPATPLISDFNCGAQPAAPAGWTRSTCNTTTIIFTANTTGDALGTLQQKDFSFVTTSNGTAGISSWSLNANQSTGVNAFLISPGNPTIDINTRVGDSSITPQFTGISTQKTYALTVTNRSSTAMRRVSIDRNSNHFQDFTSGLNPGFVCPSNAGWTVTCTTSRILLTHATGLADGESLVVTFKATTKTQAVKNAPSPWVVAAAENADGTNTFEVPDPAFEISDRIATAAFQPTNPAALTGGVRTTLTLRVTLVSRGAANRNMGTATVDVPVGFTDVSFSSSSTVTSTLVPTSLSGGVNEWSATYDATARRILLRSVLAGDVLNAANSFVEVPVTVTPPTSAGSSVWPAAAWQDFESLATEEFVFTTLPSADVASAVVPTKLAFTTSAHTITAGNTSGTITVERQDAANTPATTGPLTVYLSSTSGAGVFRNVADDTTITTVTIPDGSSTASFKYRDTIAGTPTLTAADQAGVTDTGLTDATQQQTVNPGAASATTLEDAADGTGSTIPAQDVTSGSSVTAYLIARDAYGNFVENTAANTWSLVNITGGVDSGDLDVAGDLKSAEFTGALVGAANIRAAKAGFGNAQSGLLTVIAGPASAITVEDAADGTGGVLGPQNVTSGLSETAYLITRDAAGNFVGNPAADTWSLVNKTGGVVDGDLVGAGSSATFTGVLVGTAQIRATKSGFSDADSNTLTVVHGAPASLVLTGSTGNLGIGETRVVTATVKDAAGNVTTTGPGAVASVTFAKDSGTGTVSGLGASTAAAGVATKTVTGTGLGSITLKATTTLLTSNGLTFTVVPGATVTTADTPDPASVQFSDEVTLSATITGATPEGGAITGTVTFKIGTITVATGVPVDTNGVAEQEVAILSPSLPASSTPYTVTAEFTSTNPFYANSSDNTQTLTITKEHPGTVTYIGDTYVTTPGTSAVVNLAATVGQPLDGSFANFNTLNTGGSRYVVKFYSGTTLLGTANVTNALDWATTGAGFAHTTVSLNMGSSPHAIEARLVQTMPYFTFAWNGTEKVVASDGDQVLVIAPVTGLSINGGGWVPDTASTNGKGNYGFTVKFNNKLSNLQGNALFIWRSTDPAAVSVTNPTGAVDIKVKTSSLATLSQVGTAATNAARLTGKANVQVIDAASGLQIGGFGGGSGNNFNMTVKDNAPDGYSMQVRKSDGSVYKQIGNPLNGTSPTFVTPGGGQIVVRLR